MASSVEAACNDPIRAVLNAPLDRHNVFHLFPGVWVTGKFS